MKPSILFILACLCLLSCNKKEVGDLQSTVSFTDYTIRAGQHYADQNQFRKVSLAEQKFIVVFDSSAIYTTSLAENQYDINKLYGFSDNQSNHHAFSARFGWRWSEQALRLFAYVYNESAVISKEITTIPIGTEVSCSIKVLNNRYVFTVNGTSIEMPRTSKTEKAEGYQLYPYFGGDEPAPHAIRIRIREMM